MTTLYIIVPCFNEEEILMLTAEKLKNKISGFINDKKISEESRVLFVDDGSLDNTWSIIENLHKSDSTFGGLKLTKNFGYQHALLAGLMTARSEADAVITIDADLQDDIDAMDNMLDCFEKGNEIVYGVRSSRKSDTMFKRLTAEMFYKMLIAFGVETVFNHADYRLMSKKALDTLAEYGETNLYLRGLVPTLGFKSEKVLYDRSRRTAGKSKYSLGRMMSLAWDGITSFSVKPADLIVLTGTVLNITGLLGIVAALIFSHSFNLILLFALLLLTGIIVVSIGVVGQYVARTYMELKRRPRYIVEKRL